MTRCLLVLALLAACGDDSATDDSGTVDGGDRDAPGADASGTDAPGTDAPGEDAADRDTGTGDTLSARYPGDEGIASDPSVLFHDDFESGWGRWDGPSDDTQYLTILSDSSVANGGERYLQSRVTTVDLAEDMYISASPRVGFERVEEVWWRFYAQFPEVAPNPHHWIRLSAGNESWERSGLANTVPDGNDGFWFDLDANNDDHLNFYVYWHQMRSGRCNDGSAVPGCAGDQGTTYYYGNVFRPPGQAGLPKAEWVCIELRAKANTVGEMDGELSFWIDDELIGDYRPGYPDGTWLRATFHTGGCEFSACTDPMPFEGFDFRTSDEVGFKAIHLDAYYERDSSASKRMVLEERGLTVSDAQTIWYDDIVVATERIGCRR